MSKNVSFPIVENNCPKVIVQVAGPGKSIQEVVATVDTGFSGFLQIPLSVGISCHLNLWGTQRYTLADGSTTKNLTCYGMIKFHNKEVWGIITLCETSDDSLLGMQFLQELGMDFLVSVKDKVAIFSEKNISPISTTPTAILSQELPQEVVKK